MLILESPWTRQPQGADPLRSEYAGTFLQGVIAGRFVSGSTVNTAASSVTSAGRAKYLSGAGGHVASPTTATSDPWTLLAYVVPRAIAGLAICTHAESPGSSTQDRSLMLLATGGAAAHIYDGANKVISVSSGVVAGTSVVVGASCANGVLRIYAGGQTNTTAVSNNGFTGFTTPELVVGYGGGASIAGGASDLTSNIDLLYLLKFKGEWSYEQFERIRKNPWQPFAPQQIIIPTPAATSYTHPTLSLATATEIGATSFKPRVTYEFV